MPVFVDPRTGEVFANVPDDQQERARREFGLVSEDEYDHQTAVKEADEGIGGAISTGFQRGLGHVQDIARSAGLQGMAPGSEAFGPGGGLLPMGLGADAQAPPVAPLPPAGAETFPGGFDESARLQREAHPIASGIGTGLASAPFAALAGAAGGAFGGPAVLGAGLLGVGAEAAVEGVAQEYDDAWFEKRPFELKNVAANTLMFSGLDFAFRGALKGIGSALTGKPAATKGALGGRNVVSEAQGAARELVDPVGGSVGAARAADLEEPFVDAIKQMPDDQAVILARDADDHLHLVSQDASESFTRLNNSLSDDLGNQLKYEDIGTYAQEFDPKTLERQAQWWTSVSDDADSAARRISALAEGDTTALDFGNLGKKATQTIDDFNRRISETVDPGQRMILVDEFKKRLDKLTLSIDASHSVDAETRKSLKELIAPTRETLRKGLESKKLFGGAADLQKSLNKPWHGLLEHWREVQDTLTQKTGHVEFDVAGAGRITRESTVDRMRSVLGKDPRSNQEFGRHLTGVLENLQGLIDARQAYGIARKDGLDAVEQDIRNMMEDWNLAQTIGTARNRVDAMKKNPRNIMQRVMNISETLPMVGNTIRTARSLGEVLQDIHLDPKTPTGRVWDTAYKRFAQNTAFQDPVIISNYSPWVADALKARGGKFMPPAPPAGAVGSPAIPGMPPANANAQRSVAQPQLSPAAQGALARSQARAQQGGMVNLGSPPFDKRLNKLSREVKRYEARIAQRDEAERAWQDALDSGASNVDELESRFNDLAIGAHHDLENALNQLDGWLDDAPERFSGLRDQLSEIKARHDFDPVKVAREFLPKTGATAGNPVRPDFSDPKVFYAETPASKKVSTDALSEDENDFLNAWQQNDKWFKSNERAADYEVPEWVADLKARGVPESTLKKLEVQDPTEGGKSPLYRFSNGGELGPDGTWVADNSSVTYQPGVVAGDFGNEVFFFPEVRRASVLDNSQREAIIPRGEKFRVVDTYKDGARTVHVMAQEGSGPAMAEPKRASAPSKRRKRAGERGFVEAGDGPNFSLGDVARSPMGLVTGVGGAVAGANALMQEPEPPPAQPPEHAYRDALREIEQAGQSQVRALASDALRAKPRGKDRDPLSLFAGKRKLQDAVEETRERLDEIAADPSTLLQQLGDSAGDLGKTHPSVYMAMTEKAAQVAAYLQAVIPARTATTLLDPVGAAPSFDRAWDYAARFVGATQPRVALREAVRGGAPPEMLEAVQETWPELWSAFQVETLGQIQRMHAAGRHIPSEKLRRLDSLLGLGGQLDPSASLEVTQHMLAAQDAELAKRQEAGQATGAMPSSGPAAASFRTRLAAISAERQTSP